MMPPEMRCLSALCGWRGNGGQAVPFPALRACDEITCPYQNVLTHSGEATDLSGIVRRFKAVGGSLDDRSRRLVVAAESTSRGRGAFPQSRARRVFRDRSFAKAWRS
jgi:hypothetical protein